MTAARFAVITGSSSGIGHELARIAATEGFDVLVVADDDAIHLVSAELKQGVTALQADLATEAGVKSVVAAVAGRKIDLLAANAGRALGHRFIEQSFPDIRKVIDTNVVGTVQLVHALLPQMIAAGEGRIMITGSIAGFMSGPGLAVYNSTKAFLNLFAQSLGEELRDTPLTVTCLQPGATATLIFQRAGIANSPIGRQKKDDPAVVARAGFDAAMRGESAIVSGITNKLLALGAKFGPSRLVAASHRRATDPRR